LKQAFEQFNFMFYELTLVVNRRWWRWITCWLGGSAGVIVSYRLDRFGYLLFKNVWPAIRVLFYPIFLVLRMISASHEIHYAANIGRGLKILHPSLGVVINGKSILGEHLILTGGNCIGKRNAMGQGSLVVGSNVFLGANAVVLGPIRIGNRVQVGAGAVVIDDLPNNVVVVGVPAKIIKKITE